MTDFAEMFRHWNAGRSQVQIHHALNIDRKAIRKYLAPALAEGLAPSPGEVFDEELWRACAGVKECPAIEVFSSMCGRVGGYFASSER